MASKTREEKLKRVARLRERGLIAVLEDVHDPHNAAAVLRTCDALGVQEVWLVFEREARYDPRRVGRESSSSANKWLDFRIFESAAAGAAALRREGYEIVAAVDDGDAEPIFAADLSAAPLALCFGNEHRGLSPELIAAAHRTLTIPMRGMVESLNISVAAALCLFEAVRQREVRGDTHALTAAEAEALQRRFLKR